jgi:hypothetical protein
MKGRARSNGASASIVRRREAAKKINGLGLSPFTGRTDFATISSHSAHRDLLDHLVCGGQQGFWDGETERLGGFEVDCQLELGSQLDRKFGRLHAT